MAERVMVIGWDGGTWRALDHLMAIGLMPHLQRLCGQGSRSVLQSTVPALTPTGWTSYATGMNPGKHGVMGFIDSQAAPGSYWSPLPRRDSIMAPTLWRRLSELGQECLVLSVPVTYPPEPVRGALLSGIFTPGINAQCTYPAQLKDELIQSGCMPPFSIDLPGEAFNPNLTEADRAPYYQKFLDELRTGSELLCKATLHLMDRPWQFCTTVFVATDRIQHAFWDRIERLDRKSTDPIDQGIMDFYAMLDDTLGRMVAAAGSDCTTMLISDHGFGRCDGRYYIRYWMGEKGYYKYKPRRMYHFAKYLVNRLGLRDIIARRMSRATLAKTIGSKVPADWSRTKAYLTAGGMQINLKGRETQGTVEQEDYHVLREELRQGLLQLRCPKTNKPVIDRVSVPEELYEGPYLEWARDLIIEPTEEPYYEFTFNTPNGKVVEPMPAHSGSHRPDGILLVSGPAVQTGATAPGAHLMDIAPTVMWRMGLDVPTEMDGKVLREAFASDPAAATIACGTVDDSYRQDDQLCSVSSHGDEELKIQERLRNLGYLD